jgi:phage tail sheath gpL-like
MPYTSQYMKVFGKTAGSDLCNKLLVLNNVSIANAFRNIGKWFEDVAIGARTFNGEVIANGVPASGTVTFTAIVATDTVTVGGVVFTAVAAGATNNQFNVGGSQAITAANFAAAIEASTTSGVQSNLSAVANGAVITITVEEPGTIGNFLSLAISAHGTVSAATLTGGTDGTITPLAKGI